MPVEMIDVIQICSVCRSDLGTFSEKKENLMLSAVDYIWCENCRVTVPAFRDIAKREASVAKEVESYPRSL